VSIIHDGWKGDMIKIKCKEEFDLRERNSVMLDNHLGNEESISSKTA